MAPEEKNLIERPSDGSEMAILEELTPDIGNIVAEVLRPVVATIGKLLENTSAIRPKAGSRWICARPFLRRSATPPGR